MPSTGSDRRLRSTLLLLLVCHFERSEELQGRRCLGKSLGIGYEAARARWEETDTEDRGRTNTYDLAHSTIHMPLHE